MKRKSNDRLKIACHRFATESWGQFVTLALIAFAALVLGLEGSRTPAQGVSTTLWVLDKVVFLLFAAEAWAKWYGLRSAYLKSGWNIFDLFVVSAFALELFLVEGLEMDIQLLTSIRVLRIVRVCEVIPPLRRHAEAIARSFPGLLVVSFEALAVVFILGLMGRGLFGHIDAENWGTLVRASDSVFFGVFRGDTSMAMYRKIGDAPAGWVAWIARGYFGLLVLAGGVFLARIFGVVKEAMDNEDLRNGQEATH